MKIPCLFIVLSFLGCGLDKQQPNTEPYVASWIEKLKKTDGFISEEDCDPQNAADVEDILLAIPNQLNKSFADMNRDGTQDVLVSFSPIQCEGGNATENFQYALILLSKENTYQVIEEIPSENLGLGGSFYHFDKAVEGGISAKYFEYKEEDGRCCPSIQKNMILKIAGDTISYHADI